MGRAGPRAGRGRGRGGRRALIEVLRIGERLVRDDRVTTHAALVARAFGARRIFMDEAGEGMRRTVGEVGRAWGGDFDVELVESWRHVLRRKRGSSAIVHLTMYGLPVGDAAAEIASCGRDLLVVIGAGKVPREVYDAADYNVAVGSQPHSEIAALAVLLDRVQEGRQFGRVFPGARRVIVPSGRGKEVVGGEGGAATEGRRPGEPGRRSAASSCNAPEPPG